MFHEYPKAMYRMGEYASARDASHESLLAADGWCDYYSDQERLGTPKREPKADEVGGLEALRAEATKLGIKVHHLWKEARLRDEIAKAT